MPTVALNKSPNWVYVLFILYAIALATSMAAMETLGIMLTLVAIVGAVMKKWPVRKVGVECAFLIFSIVVFIGAGLATGLPTKLRIDVFGQLRWILLLYSLVALLAGDVSLQKRFVVVLLGLYSFVAVYGIFQSFTGETFFGPLGPPDLFSAHNMWRARGFFSNTMSYAYALGQLLAVAFGLLLTSSADDSRRKIYRGLFFVLAVGLTFTFTRGAWVGCACALLAMAFLANWRMGAAVAAVIGVLAIGGYIGSPTVRERVAVIMHSAPPMADGSTNNADADQSLTDRYSLWRVNWEMFKDHPWFGVGYGYNYFFTADYNQKVYGHPAFAAQTHNNFLQILAGCGFIGFFAWLWFCGYFLWLSVKTFWRERATNSWLAGLALGIFGAQVFFHIGGLTQSTFFDSKPLYVLLNLWAVLIAATISRD